MDHDQTNRPPSLPIGDYPDEPAKWPGVVGTISIVWGALSLMCAGCGILSPMLMGMAMKSAEAQLGPMPEVMKPGTAQVVLAGISFLWAILLLVAGIMLTLRKPVARPLHLLYAAGSIVMSIAAGLLGVMAQMRVAEWVANNPDSPWAQQHQQQPPAMTYAILAVTLLIGLAWPVFCLIWFGAVKRDSASISRGLEPVV